MILIKKEMYMYIPTYLLKNDLYNFIFFLIQFILPTYTYKYERK